MRVPPSVNPRPFRPVSPGEILRDELRARRWTQAQLARKMKFPVRAVSDLINGQAPITAEAALALGLAFGTSAEMWMTMESNFQLDSARRRLKRLTPS